MTALAEPAPEEITAIAGPLLLEFGTGWCGHCAAAQALIATSLSRHPGVRHVKVEDGPGRRLGRIYRVKLWPTLVFLRDGQELARVVRPPDADAIDRALAGIVGAP